MAKVTTIPATISRFTATPINEKKKRRTAAYARVSTDSEEQLTSYSAQVDYYTNYIKSRDDWEFVSVYTDEGITGTNTKHREGFKRMVADALAGKIDLIVTKSVSRFARNTVDSLTTVRQLKEKGVDVSYEETLADVIRRDKQDEKQSKAAEDSILLDNSELDFNGTVKRLLEIVEERTGVKHG